MLSEELRRLREKVAQWGDRPLKGGDLAYLIDQVSSDMREANPGPGPYDLSNPQHPVNRRASLLDND